MYFQNVMIVDDDSVDRFILRKSLNKINFSEQILEVSNGVEALNIITNYSKQGQRIPELIFLDLNMPVLDGFGFLDTISKLNGQYKNLLRIVIICSTKNDDEYKRALAYDLVINFFLKPISEQDLLSLTDQLQHPITA